jgi:hypothetical protein
MNILSNICMRFGADGRSRVEASLRPPPGSHIAFYPYDDEPPIVSIDDGTVSVTVTVPDRKHVTQDDVHTARALQMAFRNYATELAQALERQHIKDAAGGGEAA